ncbi:MAG: hypothetical protein ACRDHY_03975 [Anaerolineales bacterium]
MLASIGGAARQEAQVLLLVLAVHVLLVSPDLMPGLDEINPHDEAKYIESGKSLLDLEVRDLGWGPLVALVYAPFHLVLGGSPDWFLGEARAGRYLLYLFLWLATLRLGTRFQEVVHPYVLAGLLFVSGAYLTVLANPADALFVSFSILALADALAFYRSREPRHIATASAWAGLGALARIEGVLLIGVLAGLCLAMSRPLPRFGRSLPAAVLPAGAILALATLAHGLSTGRWDPGVANRAYASFEWNQSVVSGGNFAQAQEQTARLFGTQEENGGSVIRAALRNPAAFGLRLLANARRLPDLFLDLFGRRLGPAILLFAGWGVYALRRWRTLPSLGIVLAWSLPALVSLAFYAPHIVSQLSYVPLLLGAIGVSDVMRGEATSRERQGHLISASALALYALLDAKPAFLVSGLLVAAVFTLREILRRSPPAVNHAAAAALLTLLAAGLILRGPFPFPDYRQMGNSPEEQAIHILQRELPPRSRVLTPFPLPALAAGMEDVGPGDLPDRIATPESFQRWLAAEGIRGVYWDTRNPIRSDLAPWIEGSTAQILPPAQARRFGPITVYILSAGGTGAPTAP